MPEALTEALIMRQRLNRRSGWRDSYHERHYPILHKSLATASAQLPKKGIY